MAKGENWSDTEILATVADYMRMLALELSGQPYNKTAHRRELLKKLNERTESAIELKHQNISAVLREFECVWIPGYKPRGNYQEALAKFVEHWINTHHEFDLVSKTAVEQPAFVPSSVDFSRFVVDPPEPLNQVKEKEGSYVSPRMPIKRDYFARESRNAALGQAGELLVLEYEDFRLRSAGKKHLAERIDHVSTIKGDGLGFDVLSFELTGQERFIEVKTTAFAKETPFFASQNEVSFARETAEQYYLYRLFEFRKLPKLFYLQGGIESYCALEPASYICRFR